MGRINIAVECNIEHKASIYTLITSIIVNKNKSSRYHIYLLCDSMDEKEWKDLLTLSGDSVEISICEKKSEELLKQGKLIYLKWNTLVMGDLTQLYDIDLEGKAFAAAENLPENIYNVPFVREKYNSSVMLIDLTKWNIRDEYKELSIYYNYGYDQLKKNKEKVNSEKLAISEKRYEDLKDWALILRIDEADSPEKYFDGPLSELWMKFYKISPMGEIPLTRSSSIETVGTLKLNQKSPIPVLMTVEDSTVPYAVALIYSMKDKLNKDRQLDIRLLYSQLSQAHKQILLDIVSEDLSIVLYNTQEYDSRFAKASFELLTPLVFADYDKALCINTKTICIQDISQWYDLEMEDYLVRALDRTEEIQDGQVQTSEDIYFKNLSYKASDIMLINIKEWYTGNVSEKLQSLLNNREYKNYSVYDILNIVCKKKMGSMPEGLNCKEDEYADMLETYLSMSSSSEKLKEEVINYEMREDENVKEVLSKLEKLEADNIKLRNRNKELEKQNKTYKKERDKFLYEILETRKSITYKIGRAITFIPRKLRGNK